MGLIKTAIISGAAMYSAKQIAREAGRRYNNQQQAKQQDRSRESSSPRGYARRDYDRGYYSDEEYYEPPPPRRGQRQLSDQPAYYKDAAFDRAGPTQADKQGGPPPYRERPAEYLELPLRRRRPASYGDVPKNYYAPPQRRQRGFVEPYEVEEDQLAESSGSSRNALLQQAMQFAQGGGKEGSKGGAAGNVQEFLGGFMGR